MYTCEKQDMLVETELDLYTNDLYWTPARENVIKRDLFYWPLFYPQLGCSKFSQM